MKWEPDNLFSYTVPVVQCREHTQNTHTKHRERERERERERARERENSSTTLLYKINLLIRDCKESL